MEKKQLIDILKTAIAGALADVHTLTVARVTAVNKSTINCRPVVNRVVNGQSVDLPEFVDVPVFNLQGGAARIVFPITVGDSALLLFSERCFDRWYNGQDYQPPLELRMHDYSDGFALVGVNPEAIAIAIPSDSIQLVGDVEHTGNLTITGDVVINGSLTVNGDIVGDSVATSAGIDLDTHTHGGVTPGSGSTGLPQ